MKARHPEVREVAAARVAAQIDTVPGTLDLHIPQLRPGRVVGFDRWWPAGVRVEVRTVGHRERDAEVRQCRPQIAVLEYDHSGNVNREVLRNEDLCVPPAASIKPRSLRSDVVVVRDWRIQRQRGWKLNRGAVRAAHVQSFLQVAGGTRQSGARSVTVAGSKDDAAAAPDHRPARDLYGF